MTEPDDKGDATPPKKPSDRKPKKARPPGGTGPRSGARKRDAEPPPASPPQDNDRPARRGFGIRSEGDPDAGRSDRPRPGPGRPGSRPGGGGRNRPGGGDGPPWRQAGGGDHRRGAPDGPRGPRPGGFRPGGGPRRDADRPPDRRLPDDRAQSGGRFQRDRPGPPGRPYGDDRQPFQGGRPSRPSFDRPNRPPFDRQDRPPFNRASGPRHAGPRPAGPRPPFAAPRPPYPGPRPPYEAPRPGPGPRPPWAGPPGRQADPPQFRDRRPPPPTDDLLDQGEELVAGRRPVEEAFVARRPAIRLLVVPQRRQALERLVLHATSLRIPIIEVEGGTLTAVAGFDGHQGIALVVGPRRFASLDEILARSIERTEPPFVLALDSLEDPQNVGTLLRSAEAAGVHGVIFPTHRQAPLSPSAVKASAGAVEHLLLCPGRRPAGRPVGSADPRPAGRRCRGRRAADRPPVRSPRAAGDRRRQRGPGPFAGGPPPLRFRGPDPDARGDRVAQCGGRGLDHAVRGGRPAGSRRQGLQAAARGGGGARRGGPEPRSPRRRRRPPSQRSRSSRRPMKPPFRTKAETRRRPASTPDVSPDEAASPDDLLPRRPRTRPRLTRSGVRPYHSPAPMGPPAVRPCAAPT